MNKQRFITYKNGNCMTSIDLNDGTKIHETIDPNATEFNFEFSESCDFNITDKCDGGCPWCYQNCTNNSKHGDIMNLKFLDTLHPYTELAINGNDLTHPDLVQFLEKMKNNNIIISMTVNQKHFELKENFIKELLDKKLIKGLGVSLVDPTQEFISKIQQYPTAVIHTIAGIVTNKELDILSNNNLKVLILGYKEVKRGKTYFENEENRESIISNINLLKNSLTDYFNKFNVVSFDNLALDQLDIKSLLTNNQWDEFYQGKDGSHTFYIDGVKEQFARTSMSEQRYDLLDNINDMFEIIKNK